ncbi:hypothetical protein FOPE_08262 [Fonsecaea pedrosoi]|nr:hypothetical protein FOPE_08262 [Fonsecaea pedrosoi]
MDSEAAWTEARARVEKRRAQGIRRDCIIEHLLDEYVKKGFPFTQRGFNLLMGEVMEGSADTTASQICTLILAFALHLEVQEKGRKEVDAVCGTERSPKWTDFQKMPYVNAIVKEGMHWRPRSPTALPHVLKEGTIIQIASWAMHHDENLFKNEDDFNLDRYIGYTRLANNYAGIISPDWSPETTSATAPGDGCARELGIHLAERSMWRILCKVALGLRVLSRH